MRVVDRRNELMPREELGQLQLERLQALLARLRRSVRRYRETLADARVDSLDDLKHLPFTTPRDLAESFPYGMFALPLREVIRLHSTVGPNGKPLIIGHTRNDVAQWGRLVARQLVAAGVTANDIIQISLGGAIHHGAAGYALGAETIEASIIAEDPMHIDYQLAMLKNYRPTVLITTPLNASRLMAELERRHMDPQSFSLRAILLSRPVDTETRERLRAGLFSEAKCNFGIGEIMDPGLCVECEAGHFHVNEDHFLVERVEGELVITTLTREAVPLLRYRTRIACEMAGEPCSCGRTGVVVTPGRRVDGRLRVAETPLYESQIADVLAQTLSDGVKFKFQTLDDRIDIEVPMTAALFGDTIRSIERLESAIQSEFRTRFGLDAQVHFTEGSSPETNA